jgi:hypothetical protein
MNDLMNYAGDRAADSPSTLRIRARGWRVNAIWLLALIWLASAFAGNIASANDRTQVQRALIDATLSGFVVEPAPPARVFFLGFAGYGEERVFAEEIKFAAARVASRFGSGQRSLLLINDRRDLTTHPLATHDNLRYALREIGRRMNPASDVLFLVLSSHGARNAMIEVSNVGAEPVGLSVGTLEGMLSDAGIRQRVIVVSACFSGAFIAPLADNHTIVITASSKSRTSFGCSDDRDLTYFGEAFFRDALPATRTLREAFEITRRDIRAREKAERFTSSQPQSHFGPVLETTLEELERVRAAPAMPVEAQGR